MIGIGHISPQGTLLHDGQIAHIDFFAESIVRDSLERLYIAIHPGSIDPANRAVWFDLSPNRNNATLFNNPALDDNGWTFDGVNQFGSYTWPLAGRSEYFTVEMWVKPDTAQPDLYFGGQSSGGTLFRRASSGGSNYVFQFQFNSAGGFSSVITANHTEPVDRIYHLCFIRDGARMRIAVNGTFLTLNTVSGTPSGELVTPMNWIGRYINSYFPGKFYYYALYSKALNDEEVSYNYNKNKTRFV